MNTLDKQYQSLLQDILDNGVKKEDRTGTGTISVFGRQIRHKMSEGFPLLTTKKMPFKTIVTELLWFLRGDTDIRFLWKNNCFIWDGDWYKQYISTCSSPYSLDEMKKFALAGDTSFHDSTWNLGPIYGKQWRGWNGIDKESFFNSDNLDERDKDARHGMFYKEQEIDQIQNLINELKTNPDSRRLMVNAWNVADLPNQVLPPCHYGFQVYTRELTLDERMALVKPIPNLFTHEDCDAINLPKRAISLMWNQRSVDTLLGLPFNIASYGLLLEIIAKEVNMVPDELIGNLGDTHLYLNHIEQAKEQIVRDPYELPTLKFMKTDEFFKELSENISLISHLDNTDFELIGYQSHPTIKAPLSN